ncbi:MAG: ATP-dependent Clp protease proteolytic subunit [Clostridia bacterium]|nr:ATP-dependent Clp protease proteolytic subunit [Clostridia bacterium]
MKNVIAINGEINHETYLYVAKQLVEILTDNNEQIYVIINSHGGCVDVLFELLDLFESVKERITTFATNNCESSAAYLFLCGTKRIVDPLCKVLFHTVSVREDFFIANVNRLQYILKEVKRKNKKLEWLVKPFNLPRHTWRLLFNEHKNVVFTPEECLQYGLATEVAEIDISINKQKDSD